MLHTYQAQIDGSQLIWIDPPPVPLAHARVLIVVERAEPTPINTAGAGATQAQVQTLTDSTPRNVFMASEGCMGHTPRQDIDAQLTAMRNEWQIDLKR